MRKIIQLVIPSSATLENNIKEFFHLEMLWTRLNVLRDMVKQEKLLSCICTGFLRLIY